MKKDDAVAALKSHLAKRGYGDIEVNVSGGYDGTQTDADFAWDQRADTVAGSIERACHYQKTFA